MSVRPDAADWVLVGQQHRDGGVVVFASQTLSSARLREEIRLHAEGGHADQWTDVTLTVHMDGYLKVRADNYAEALLRLFSSGWAPDALQIETAREQ